MISSGKGQSCRLGGEVFNAAPSAGEVQRHPRDAQSEQPPSYLSRAGAVGCSLASRLMAEALVEARIPIPARFLHLLQTGASFPLSNAKIFPSAIKLSIN